RAGLAGVRLRAGVPVRACRSVCDRRAVAGRAGHVAGHAGIAGAGAVAADPGHAEPAAALAAVAAGRLKVAEGGGGGGVGVSAPVARSIGGANAVAVAGLRGDALVAERRRRGRADLREAAAAGALTPFDEVARDADVVRRRGPGEVDAADRDGRGGEVRRG